MNSTNSTKGGRGKPKSSKSVSRSQKAGLQFPIGRIARFLKARKYAERVGAGGPVSLSSTSCAPSHNRDNRTIDLPSLLHHLWHVEPPVPLPMTITRATPLLIPTVSSDPKLTPDRPLPASPPTAPSVAPPASSTSIVARFSFIRQSPTASQSLSALIHHQATPSHQPHRTWLPLPPVRKFPPAFCTSNHRLPLSPPPSSRLTSATSTPVVSTGSSPIVALLFSHYLRCPMTRSTISLSLLSVSIHPTVISDALHRPFIRAIDILHGMAIPQQPDRRPHLRPG